MHAPWKSCGLIIVGAGPAGLAPLFAAANSGHLDVLLRRGITILERSHTLGSGALSRYAISSDSSAEALLDIVLRSRDPRLASLHSHPATRAVAQAGKGAVSLKAVGAFLEVAAEVLCDAVSSSDNGRVIRGATAQWIQKTAAGGWRVHYTDAYGGIEEIESEDIVLATGASQPLARLETELVAGISLLPRYSSKLMQSDEVLTQNGMVMASGLLRGKPHPKIAVVGGSTSAASVVLKLLNQFPDVQFGDGAITLLHREPLRLFYETSAEALSDGYNEFSEEDICALTGRVFRLSGFRLESRELVMQLRGLAARPPEPRVRLLQLKTDQQGEARACLDEADLVIAALGYRPNLIPVFDREMQRIALFRPGPKGWSVVDQHSRLLTADRLPLEGLFAVGLAIGPAASKEFGGEAGFRGQVNSLWLWQHTMGQNIVKQLYERVRDRQNFARHVPGEDFVRTATVTRVVERQKARPRAAGVS